MERRHLKIWYFLFALGQVWAGSAFSSNYYGRTSFGVFFARERFSDDLSGSDSSDFANGVGRLFLLNRSLWSEQDEFSIDMRDRYSLYDRLNRQQLSLESHNVFQLTKFYYRQTRDWGTWTFGRTSVVDAGGVYVDGFVVEKPLNLNWNIGAFVGANPKRSDQSYVEGNKDSTIQGFFATYQPKFLPWGKNVFVSHGLVSEKVKAEEDRRFLTQVINYQSSPKSQFIETLYLDFVPRTYVQTGSLAWLQEWNNLFSSRVNLLGVDVIEYARRQGVRERLTPSPYKEVEGVGTIRTGSMLATEIGMSSGLRSADGLKRTDSFLKLKSLKEILPRQLLELKFGHRANFTSNDQYLQGSWTFYNDRWELVVDFEKTKEVYKDGVTLNGSGLSGDVIYLYSKSLFLSGSFQYAADERVKIYSSLVRLNYRFGSTELPSLRDGAPPASRL